MSIDDSSGYSELQGYKMPYPGEAKPLSERVTMRLTFIICVKFLL